MCTFMIFKATATLRALKNPRTLMRSTHRGFVRSLPVVLLLLLLAPPCRASHHHAPAGQPDIRSNAVLVLDEGSSRVLLSRQAEVAVPIASITKLMTAIVVLEGHQSLEEMVQITDEDRERGRGAYSRLAIGTQLSRGDLLHLALMSSENRAAHALGRTYPGGVTAFVAAMNARATALGMTGAHFVDPTGLSSDNMASPADLSKLVIAASHEPTIQQYSTDETHSIRMGRKTVEFRNTDYITEAGRCLVIKALIRGRAIVIVLLDSFGRYTRVADAQRIKRWLEAMPAEMLIPT
jgi:serine-type D-Ala-D-Ala endopeptidase (penicillin-binding protein 7)